MSMEATVQGAGPAELALSAALERRAVPRAASAQHAVLSVVAPPTTADRAPVSLVAVLDRSGSMGGEKLRLVLATMRFMLQHLRPSDRLGVVSYDTQVRTDAPLTLCDAAGKERLEQALAQICAGSTTNLSGGLLQGLELHGRRATATFGNTYTAPLDPPAQQAGYPVQRRSRSSFSSMLSGVFSASTPAPAAPVASPPSAAEWALELRCPAGLVRAVTYTLPDEEVVEATEAPFRVARAATGAAPHVHARVTLASGVVVTLEHTVCLRPGGEFRPAALPLPAQEAPQQGVVRSTLLFTDGLANAGIRDTEGICAAARAALGESDAKSTIHTFGYGADHNAEMLRAIAQVGDGEYFFIESQDNVADSFGEAIGGLLSTTHQNIQLQLNVAPGVTAEPLTTFQSEVEDATTTITLGDLFAEETRNILVRFAVPAGAGPAPLGTATLRAYSLQQQAFETLGPVVLQVERSDVEEQGNPAVLQHVNRHVATAAMDAARREAARGDLGAARAQMAQAEERLRPAAEACQLTAGLLADLVDAQGSMQREAEYSRVGSKKLALMSKMHGKERACAYEGSAATERYSGQSQKTMKRAFKSAIH